MASGEKIIVVGWRVVDFFTDLCEWAKLYDFEGDILEAGRQEDFLKALADNPEISKIVVNLCVCGHNEEAFDFLRFVRAAAGLERQLIILNSCYSQRESKHMAENEALAGLAQVFGLEIDWPIGLIRALGIAE